VAEVTHTSTDPAGFTRARGEPLRCYRHWRDAIAGDEALLIVEFPLQRYWLEADEPLQLTAIYWAHGATLHVAVTDQVLTGDGLAPRQQYLRWVAQHCLLSFEPSTPISLHPHYIDKPWGGEIWYTGVERRGVCMFARGNARTPIPWLQAVLPSAALGQPGVPLLLLKILDPLPQPVLGDLYFELHETKHEVYVVTSIDRQAWPDGTAYIRCGFDPQQIARYPDHEEFRAAYLESVLAYETLRRELDELLEAGGTPDPAQQALELLLRERMEVFTQLHPLRVGDVFRIPPLLPHALQHGVRVVEFQTPSYERKNISFAQKVHTQDHWDSREAVARMLLGDPAIISHRELAAPPGVRVEQIVDFPDFEVWRLAINPGMRWQVKSGPSYALLLVVAGVLELAGSHYGTEQAVLLPRGWSGALVAPQASLPVVLLLAKPRG
jgi:hypothetical protein